MRLRFVKTCNFRQSELTNFVEILGKHPEFATDGKFKLKTEDVVLLVSQTGNQLVFLYNFDALTQENGAEQKVLRSIRLRMPGGAHWNPLMLANYAKSVGIPLTGLKEYEDHIRDAR